MCSVCQVAFKPAGGLKTYNDAIHFLTLVKEELGNEWICPNMLRLGASSVLNDIERRLFILAFGRAPAALELAA
jgi:deoxyribose-phosphate aldolase